MFTESYFLMPVANFVEPYGVSISRFQWTPCMKLQNAIPRNMQSALISTAIRRNVWRHLKPGRTIPIFMCVVWSVKKLDLVFLGRSG
ncbi:hypothetical protein I532_15661 [Brevibacillus borstelensis AK1]|uniref:Uncharacterized protein n=1 Tax=Brevibacillus borstelensis AK1 TaxID=1300222 RepID=M8DE84_9BACL|nr:hypothetical protein I532_15661 [Brevibacillus borstelensis AK1]